MLKVCIFEKEDLLASEIENVLDKVCQEKGIRNEIDVFNDEDDLKKAVSTEGKYDIALFCIDEESEVDVAVRMRKSDEDVLIIFISELDKILKNIVCLNAYAFIERPINEVTFEKLFLDAYYKIGNGNKYFFYSYNKEDFKILTKDILYFESKGRQVRVYVNDGGIKVFNGKLKDVEKRLEGGKVSFLRIHQSFLVNYFFIKSRMKSEVTLTNGIRLPISESKQKEFNENQKNHRLD